MAAIVMEGVPATLFAALASRAAEAGRIAGMFHDPRAVELYQILAPRVECPTKMSSMDKVFHAMRISRFDGYARRFMLAHPGALIVDIGCGLDTRFDRLDDGRLHWLGLDVPEVIDLRGRYLPDVERCRSLPCSFLEPQWIDIVAGYGRPVIFLAEGVFPYFSEQQVKPVLVQLAERFSAGELVFDAFTAFSVRLHNRSSNILKESGASLKWWIEHPESLEAWGMVLLERWGYLDAYEPRLGLANLMKFIPPLAGATFILHYRLGRGEGGPAKTAAPASLPGPVAPGR